MAGIGITTMSGLEGSHGFLELKQGNVNNYADHWQVETISLYYCTAQLRPNASISGFAHLDRFILVGAFSFRRHSRKRDRLLTEANNYQRGGDARTF
jgi:hypothetical protein